MLSNLMIQALVRRLSLVMAGIALLLGWSLNPAYSEEPFAVTSKIDDAETEVIFNSTLKLGTVDQALTSQDLGIAPDRDSTITFSWPEGSAGIVIRAWKVEQDNTTKAFKLGSACSAPPRNSATTVKVDLSTTACPDGKRSGVLFQISRAPEDPANSGPFANYYIPTSRLPVTGSDRGIALTLIDQLKEDDHPAHKGYRISQGLNFYYAFSKLNTKRLRTILSINLLDMDPDQEFEVGVGVGFLLNQLGGLKAGQSDLGLVAGVGFNAMLDDHDKAWYGFIGFSVNFQTEK